MSDQSPRLIPFFLSLSIFLPPLLLLSLLSFYLSLCFFLSTLVPLFSLRLALFYFCFLFPSLLPSYPCFLFLLPFLSPSCLPFSPLSPFFFPPISTLPLFSLFFIPPLFCYPSPFPCPFLFRPPSSVRLSSPPHFYVFSFSSFYSAPFFRYFWLLYFLSLFPIHPCSIYLNISSGCVSSLPTFSSLFPT